MIRQWGASEGWIESLDSENKDHVLNTVALRELLTRRTAPIEKSVRPLNTLNVIAKVTFGGRLFLRTDQEKRAYKGALFEALPGDLIISKIRVGQGSFCIVTDDVTHVAVSPEYPVYAPDLARVEPRFLALSLRTPEFFNQLTQSASGNTTKRRIRPSYFESLHIPLPSLEEQRRIVDAHEAALARAAEMERDADAVEAAAAQAFEAALGFGPQEPLPDRPVFIASFKDLDRWSHEGVLRRIIEGETPAAASFPMVQLGEVIADLEVGWSPKCLDRPAEKDEWGVLKLGAVSFGAFDERQNKSLKKNTKPKFLHEVKSGDILISRGNVARLVASCVLVERTRSQLMIPDLIFRVVPKSTETIDSLFLVNSLRTKFVRTQVESRLTGTSPTMKKISKPGLLSLIFPLPPLDQQRAFVSALTKAREKAAALRFEAKAVRSRNQRTFENSVYAIENEPTPETLAL